MQYKTSPRLGDFLKFLGIPSTYRYRFFEPMTHLIKHRLISKKEEINPGYGFGTIYVVCKKIRYLDKYVNIVVHEHKEGVMGKIPMKIMGAKWQLPNCTEYREYLKEGYYKGRRGQMGATFRQMIKKVIAEDKYLRYYAPMKEQDLIDLHSKYTHAVRNAFRRGTPENAFFKYFCDEPYYWHVRYYCLNLYDYAGYYQLKNFKREYMWKKKGG